MQSTRMQHASPESALLAGLPSAACTEPADLLLCSQGAFCGTCQACRVRGFTSVVQRKALVNTKKCPPSAAPFRPLLLGRDEDVSARGQDAASSKGGVGSAQLLGGGLELQAGKAAGGAQGSGKSRARRYRCAEDGPCLRVQHQPEQQVIGAALLTLLRLLSALPPGPPAHRGGKWSEGCPAAPAHLPTHPQCPFALPLPTYPPCPPTEAAME